MTLEPGRAEGWILDIGGGGEGVIGQLFCTFMYIKGPDHETVLQQIRRVLSAGGRVSIRDVNSRSRSPEKRYVGVWFSSS